MWGIAKGREREGRGRKGRREGREKREGRGKGGKGRGGAPHLMFVPGRQMSLLRHCPDL